MLTAREMIEEVNSSSTLTQEELFSLFSRASFLINDCVRLLAEENDYIQLCVLGLGAEVASNMDRNKAIYRRPIAFVDSVASDVSADTEGRSDDFLCSCMDLQSMLTSSRVEDQIDLLLSLPLTRMVYENFIKEWSRIVSGYIEECLASAESIINNDVSCSYSSDTVCLSIENGASLNPRTGFGIARYVANRLRALSKIYDRIFNAYARVILKQAKTQSVSEDHSLDCFQNGSMGLLRAISSYDNVSNARFAGHARWWIRQSMLYSIKEDSNIIRVSSNTWQHYAKIESLRLKHESKHGPASISDLSASSGYSTSHIDNIYSMVRTSQVKSLDHPLRDDGSSTLMSIIESDAAKRSNTEPVSADSVKFLLNQLSTDSRNLVCLFYGLTEYVVQDIPEDVVALERLRQQ